MNDRAYNRKGSTENEDDGPNPLHVQTCGYWTSETSRQDGCDHNHKHSTWILAIGRRKKWDVSKTGGSVDSHGSQSCFSVQAISGTKPLTATVLRVMEAKQEYEGAALSRCNDITSGKSIFLVVAVLEPLCSKSWWHEWGLEAFGLDKAKFRC